MSVHIALLRAVNVSGRTLAMADLRALLTDLGFENPRTLLTSGNVVFEGAGAGLETRLETAFEARFGYASDVLLRTPAQWSALIAANPFPDQAKADPSHLLAAPLTAAPTAEAVEALKAASKGPELIAVEGQTAYLVYPDGIGRSKLTLTLVEKKLGVRGTGRNWNTVIKLAEMAAG